MRQELGGGGEVITKTNNDGRICLLTVEGGVRQEGGGEELFITVISITQPNNDGRICVS